jgi:hypothetical protein
MNMEKDAIKAMIELSEDWKSADNIITKFTPCKGIEQKLAYLYGMFDVSIVTAHDGKGNKIETDYRSVLSATANQKWR